MTMISMISQAPTDSYSQLVRELQTEFRCGDVGVLADRIIEAEAADFHWDARVRERYLGQHFGFDLNAEEADEELAPMAILSFLARKWHVGICLVDGEGSAVEMLWLRSFSDCADAEIAFLQTR
ncbi:MAG: hypothetical protein ABI454_10360 [Sphingomicrobium sp.]